MLTEQQGWSGTVNLGVVLDEGGEALWAKKISPSSF